MSKIDSSGPAFPIGQGNEHLGMSLRDYVAIKAFIFFLADERFHLLTRRETRLSRSGCVYCAAVRGLIMTPLPVPTPEEYRRYPAHVLERWAGIAWEAGEHAEAETIRREIIEQVREEIAA